MVYLPPVFTEARREVLIAHIERYDFGLLINQGQAGLVASHIPFLVEHAGDELHLLSATSPAPIRRSPIWPD